MPPDLWLPSHLKPAVKRIAVVFYHQPASGRIVVGFPEQFACPLPGFQKIVCRTAAEVDLWDKKMRDQERRDDEMTDEQRDAVEGPIRDYARKQLIHQMTTARNAINRDFCRAALAQMDEDDKRRAAAKKESVMHICAFEEGK